MKKGISITVSAVDRRRLEAITADRNSLQKHAWRAEIVLLSDALAGTNEIMWRTGKSKTTVWRWQERYMAEGVDGLLRDKTRPSRIPPLAASKVGEILALSKEPPPFETTHWTGALMSKATGVSVSSVQRVWRSHGLQPHRFRVFKLSNDPAFAEKINDIVGLYVNPPAHAVVLSVDEKSQIQALDRTQPSLPMNYGMPETRTHDYRRYGTTTLFSALDVATGEIIGKLKRRHRSADYISFLRHIDQTVPEDLDIHLIIDNYATHKSPKVKQWLLRHPRFHCHFTPTYSSWLNLVERFFATLTEQQLRRGTHRSVPVLEKAIRDYLKIYNEDPKPFRWTKSADEIIESVNSVLKQINRTGH